MRGTRAVVPVLFLSSFALLSLTAPALAKGAFRVTIEGPGLSQPLVLRTDDIGTLAMGSGLYAGLGACRKIDHCTPGKPAGDLGPKYTVTYIALFPNRQGRDVRNHVVQYIYPGAQPDALAYLPPGQRYAVAGVTVGGTFTISRGLLDVTTGKNLTGGTSVSPPVPPATTQAATNEQNMAPVLLVGLALLMIAVVLLMVWRRHRSTPNAATRVV